MLTLAQALTRLTINADVISQLTRGLSDEQARWKPAPNDWSSLEVVNHLYDEERDDFRTRIDLTLHHPAQEWPPIHPSRWAIERKYNERDLAASLENFRQERQNSLTWLTELSDADWEKGRQRPQAGVIKAGDLLAAWVAHDHLHIRQLNELHWQWWSATVKPYTVYYAGDW